MDTVWNIYKVLIEEDREEHFAVFTDEGKANDAINRLRARDAKDTEVDWNMRPCCTNPESLELDLPPALNEISNKHVVQAAYLDLVAKGKVFVPLWISPAWLVHEVKVQYDVGIDFKGREMTLVSEAEVQSRRSFGIPDVDAPSDFGYTDTGFTETRS